MTETGRGEAGPDAGASVGGRTAYRRAGIAAGVAALGLLAGAAALKLVFTPERLRAVVEPRLEAAVGRDVGLAAVRLQILPRLAVRLDGVTIAGPGGAGGPPAVAAETVEALPRLLPLLRGRVELEGATVDGGTVTYADPGSGRWLELAGVRASVEGLDGGPGAGGRTSRLRADAASARVFAPGIAPDTLPLPELGLEARVTADVPARSADLRELVVRIGDVAFRGAATVDAGAPGPGYALDLASDSFDVARLVAALPPSARPGGVEVGGTAIARVEARRGRAAEAPALAGSADFRGVSVTRDGTELLAGARGRVTVGRDTVRLVDLDGRLLGGPLAVDATVTGFGTGEGASLDARVRAEASLRRLAALRPDGGEASGTASAELRIRGSATRPAELRIEGPVRLAGAAYRPAPLRVPVRIAEGVVRLTGRGLATDGLALAMGGSDVTLSAEAPGILPLLLGGAPGPEASIRFRADSRRLDRDELLPGGGDRSWAELATARLTGRSVGGKDPARVAREEVVLPPVPPVPVEGRVRIEEYVNPPTTARNVAFRVESRDGRVEIRDLSGTVYGGEVDGSLTLEAASGPPYPLRYDVSVSGAESAPLLSRWTRLGDAIRGGVDARLEGSARLDGAFLPLEGSTSASGRSAFRDGRLADLGLARAVAERLGLDPALFTSFRDLGGPFRIENDAFVLEGWRYVAPRMRAGIDGTAGFDGALDLELSVELPPAVLAESDLLREAGIAGLVTTLARGRESITVMLGVGGTLSEPTLRVDRDALRREIGGSPEELLRELFRPPPS